MLDKKPADPRVGRLFTFASGGWVLLLTVVLGVVILVMTVRPALERNRTRPPGDGRDPATYGFDLTNCLVPRDTLVAGQLHRDLLPPLVDPQVMDGAAVLAFNREQRGKYVVPNDRVVGVAVGGVARAYPLSVLQLHEVANDTLGGMPILVTYNPLCDSAVVYERTIGRAAGAAAGSAEGASPVFGVSGLLHDSNLVMYDRAPAGRESLWRQFDGLAIAGPAAAEGRRLTMIPAVVTHWRVWLEAHPETTVPVPDENLFKRYQETSYLAYFNSEPLLFPVSRALPEGDWAGKTPCMLVEVGDARRLYPIPLVGERVGPDGTWADELGGTSLRFHHAADPDVAWVTTEPHEPPVLTTYGFRFAWHNFDPDVEVKAGEPPPLPVGGAGGG